MGTFKLGEALKEFIQGSKLKNGLRSAQIEEVWLEMMGVTIAKYTDKIYIFDQKLLGHLVTIVNSDSTCCRQHYTAVDCRQSVLNRREPRRWGV